MPANFPMPAADRLRDVLGDLLGRKVSVAPARAVELGSETAAVADYHVDSGAVGVLCVADLRLTNALGAALTMVPPRTVDDAVASQSIDQPTIDNFREVVNIMTSLFNTADTPHLKFNDVHRLPSGLPPEAAMLLDGPKGRRDFDVTVDEYGSGTMSVFLA
ncbi:MAG: hypothetical protein QOI55_414 [Actinomycetota bacterium]|jgi:hypothetical protein|nr:hypothetical protein [Actinomycetota bacterium]